MELPIHELKKTCSDKLGRRAVEIAGKDPWAHKAAYDSSEVVQQVQVHFPIDGVLIVAVQRYDMDAAPAYGTNLSHVYPSRVGCLHLVAVGRASRHAHMRTATNGHTSGLPFLLGDKARFQ